MGVRMPKKKPHRREAGVIDWELFLQSGRTVDALIDFIEGHKDNQKLRAACRSEACRRELDRMRVLGNYKSRQQAERFLRRYYTW